MIFLALSRWDVIRGQFTEDEKDRLNAAIAGETICPRGATLDSGKLGQELTGKLDRGDRGARRCLTAHTEARPGATISACHVDS